MSDKVESRVESMAGVTTSANIAVMPMAIPVVTFGKDKSLKGRRKDIEGSKLYKLVVPEEYIYVPVDPNFLVIESTTHRLKHLYDMVMEVTQIAEDNPRWQENLCSQVLHILNEVIESVLVHDVLANDLDFKGVYYPLMGLISELPEFIQRNPPKPAGPRDQLESVTATGEDGEEMSCLESMRRAVNEKKGLRTAIRYLPESGYDRHNAMKALTTCITRIVIEDEKTGGKVLPILGETAITHLWEVMKGEDRGEAIRFMKEIFLGE